MLMDGIDLIEGSDINNLTVDSGDATAQGLTSPTNGEMFFRTDLNEFQMYVSGAWEAIGQSSDIAQKLSKAGDTMTGALTMSSAYIGFSGSISTPSHAATIFRPLDNTIAFGTANTERMRIDSAGKVGIGVTPTATSNLHVSDSADDCTINIDTEVAGKNSVLAFSDPAQQSVGFLQYAHGDDSLRVHVNGAERMRIDGDGSLSVTTATGPQGTDAFKVNNNSSAAWCANFNSANGSDTIIISAQAGTGTVTHHQFNNSNGKVGSIETSGSTTTYNTSSDYRLKENVAPITDGIDRVKLLNPSRFNFIADPANTVDGFLAHEAAAQVPEAVSGNKDAVDGDLNPVYQGIDQSKLVPLLTAALKEEIAKNEALVALLVTKGTITQAEADAL